ncbi:hypothetical protein [Rhizomonospora bruguierae]|uniref:hypothetical protein n=1 Tax=Rhizomonospora bruguierae TaxID=1581705 RepID=UPI001BD01B22|nr:hypothetical protein [Micromonospora sp. NBRC 107566]
MTATATAATTAAAPRPAAVRALTALLAATAAATVAVEALNWWYAPERGYGLAVRTGWATLRSLGFLVLVWHVRRGRAGARPFGLILAVTTVFAVARLVVPRRGLPVLPGVLGFAAIALLALAAVLLLYRSPAVTGYLTRPPNRLVITRQGFARRPVARTAAPVPGWLLTARVAALAYGPLMLVPCLVSVGVIADGRLAAIPVVALWAALAFGVGYAVLFTSFFLLRGRRWARWWLAGITLLVVLIDLPLCWAMLGGDGLVRDGGPLAVAALMALYGLWRAPHHDRLIPAPRQATP